MSGQRGAGLAAPRTGAQQVLRSRRVRASVCTRAAFFPVLSCLIILDWEICILFFLVSKFNQNAIPEGDFATSPLLMTDVWMLQF